MSNSDWYSPPINEEPKVHSHERMEMDKGRSVFWRIFKLQTNGSVASFWYRSVSGPMTAEEVLREDMVVEWIGDGRVMWAQTPEYK